MADTPTRRHTLAELDAAIKELTADLRSAEKSIAGNVIDWQKQRAVNADTTDACEAIRAVAFTEKNAVRGMLDDMAIRIEQVDTVHATRMDNIETEYHPKRLWFDLLVYWAVATGVVSIITLLVTH